jgi:phosphoglucosamine mutase
MSAALFGTDGVRGVFGIYPLDRATVAGIGRKVAELLLEQGVPPLVVLGGDTRDSTPEITRWLATGLAAGGVRALDAGVVPTPGVAWLTRDLNAGGGIAVSASHNPHPDNGIKLIGADGFKWSRERETELERRLTDTGATDPGVILSAAAAPELVGRYRDWLVGTVAPGALRGLTVVLDLGNGAATPLAEPLFAALGARTTALNDRPDGRNINRECGSTRPELVAQAALAAGADLGIAFDGDADRAIVADEIGEVRDGDAMLYLWARDLRAAGGLEPAAIVATSMSNLGLERALQADGISVVRCDVGDRAVVETLRQRGLRLGGEQSGHIVDLDLATAGDGLLSALHIAALVARSGQPLSRLLAGFQRFPQLLRSLRVSSKRPFAGLPRVVEAQREIERRLGEQGRLVLRYSGTEPLARIMIEGPDRPGIEAMADELEHALRAELGAA